MKFSFLGGLVVALLSGTLALTSDAVREAWVWDRAALAQGEWWRLWTGHLVHFGNAHLLANLLGLGVAAGLLAAPWEVAAAGRSAWGCGLAVGLIAPPLHGIALYALEPAMHTYGGLSGLVCAGLTVAALTALHPATGPSPAGAGRIWAAALLVVIAMKSLGDLGGFPFSVFTFTAETPVRVSAWAHAAGALLGVVVFLWRLRLKSCPLPSAGVFAP